MATRAERPRGAASAGPGRPFDLDPAFRGDLDRRTPRSFAHRLTDHPSLSLEAVAALAERLGDERVVCESAVKPLVGSAASVPAADRGKRAAELIRGLDDNDSWLTLLNIETDPGYRAFIDEVVDGLAEQVSLRPDTLSRRAGFVFASSPQSVTPAHFDIEHSLLIQLRGKRVLSFGAFPDDATRADEVHRYWNGSYGRMQVMPEPQSEVELAPGTAVYIPPYQPHWLQNGDRTSLSLTIVFFTRSNENESLVQACNEKFMRLHLHPRPFGESARVDNAKVMLMRSYGAVRRRLRPDRSLAR
jgi:cupin superfamily protein